MSVEIIAVRWECFTCAATAISAPEEMPSGWFELEAPPWRAHHPPSHYCEGCASRGESLQRRRRAKYGDGQVAREIAEFERVKGRLRALLHELERVRFSAQRAADREIV